MSINFQQDPTIEIRPLGVRPKQSEAIMTDPGVRKMLGNVARQLFGADLRGLPVSSLFELRSSSPQGDDEVLHGNHLFVTGDLHVTEHAVCPVPVDYPDNDTEFVGEIESFEDLCIQANEETYTLESNLEGDADVIIDDHDDILALERLIEAAYKDEQVAA